MIPTATAITEVDNLPGKEIPFKIGNPLWVMKNLAKLYSDTAMAVIREYSTNAMDSHIMAGKADVPIEVSLPDLYSPYFVIQDFGLGMSETDLEEVYTSFGDSTKRESNDVNGMYGFGSKSAVAYTDQFIVESVKDGVQINAMVSKRPDFSMTLKIISKQLTDADNGVKITVPVGNHAEFKRKAIDFYRFWQPGTVLVDGVEPEQAVGEKIDDNLYYSPNAGTSYVVMGNVGYRIHNPEALFRNTSMTNISFVAYVEGGAVEHTPSREDLEYTDHTKKTLYSIINNFEDKIIEDVKSKIAAAPTADEAWTLWHSWGQKLGHQLFAGMDYKGKKFVTAFPVNGTRYTVPYVGGYNSRYNTDRAYNQEVVQAKSTLFVTEFTQTLSSEHKKKVRRYFEHKGLNIKYVLFLAEPVTNEWVPKENITTWDDLLKELPKQPRPALDPNRPKRPKGLFDFYTVKGKFHAKEIPVNADLFYVTAKDAKRYSIDGALKAMKADNEITVVILAVNRIEKFKRDNFAAREFVAWAKAKVVIDGESLLDAQSKVALGISRQVIAWVERLDAKQIDDPQWKLTNELLSFRKYTAAYNNNLSLASSLGMRYAIKEYRSAGDDVSLLDSYPLLHQISLGWNTKDPMKTEVITYLNAAYAAKKGKP